ncbi:MFS transporter [Oricola cellulosilytica]|uniref:MFS transporter n=1 Tax=Oricola cellulosilytica TaxID=1429082 RepID=A0A4R0P875_9HYPH|nr:MFS transporter [Oricola cellulosilytica]TCD13230.1 MFS transporter [Oricola cellulosilytica]
MRASDRTDCPAPGRFPRIAAAGAAFQGGAAAVDSATVMASLVHLLTGSALAVGYASAVLRLGWLLPQMVVGYLADRAERRMPFYIFGAFGRAAALALIAGLLWWCSDWPPVPLALGFLGLWTVYAFVSGVVAVPYNDIVGRTIPSERRSRMLAWRFFGGGLLGLAVAAVLRIALDLLPPLEAFALIFAVGSALMLISSFLFVSAGEPAPPPKRQAPQRRGSVVAFLREGLDTVRRDPAFRQFLIFQWLGSATLMALPFYVVAASGQGLDAAAVGTLLAAQTTGSLVSNPLWGRLGDRAGKLRLLEVVAVMRIAAPLLVLVLIATGVGIAGFVVLFVLIGMMMNGVTIGFLGFLMEISPDDRRSAYSSWFNTFAAPAALSPIVGAALVSIIAIEAVFVLAALAAIAQIGVLSQMGRSMRIAR